MKNSNSRVCVHYCYTCDIFGALSTPFALLKDGTTEKYGLLGVRSEEKQSGPKLFNEKYMALERSF